MIKPLVSTAIDRLASKLDKEKTARGAATLAAYLANNSSHQGLRRAASLLADAMDPQTGVAHLISSAGATGTSVEAVGELGHVLDLESQIQASTRQPSWITRAPHASPPSVGPASSRSAPATQPPRDDDQTTHQVAANPTPDPAVTAALRASQEAQTRAWASRVYTPW